MLFGGEDIAEAETHHDAAAQFCLGKVSLAGGVDAGHGLAVLSVGCFVIGVLETKTDDAHHHGGGDFKARISLDPAGEELGEPQVFANSRGNSFPAECSPHDPRLE